jgi:chromosome segregation ATPase
MRLDDLPAAFEAFLDHARGILNAEVEKARKLVDSLNAEKTAAAKAVANLKKQHALAEDQLNAVLANVPRTVVLAELDGEIVKVRKELPRLKSEVEKTSAALQDLAKQRAKAETELADLHEDARQYRAERADATAEINRIRSLVESACMGRSA